MKEYFICMFFFCSTTVFAQEKKESYNTTINPSEKKFTLEGTIDADTGHISLWPDSDYDTSNTNQVAIIQHGKFTFTGTAAYPTEFRLAITGEHGLTYLSGLFYIEPGTQTIICHKDSLRELPVMTNNTMKELSGTYKQAMAPYTMALNELDHENDSLRTIYGKLPDSLRARQHQKMGYLITVVHPHVLMAYTKKHPGSYVALWHLATQLEVGYQPVYDSIYALFSAPLRHSYTGIAIKKRLDGSKMTAVGSFFPQLSLLDTSLTPQTVPRSTSTHRYTLIDFWFAHCSACKAQFPGYKKLYDTYKGKQLEILAISIDDDKTLADWKNVINQKQLPWPQYLDKGGAIANVFSITRYPTNYLVDEHNVVIKRDISPEQLAVILAQQ